MSGHVVVERAAPAHASTHLGVLRAATFIAAVRHDSPGGGYSCGPTEGVSCRSGSGVDGVTRGWRRRTGVRPLTGGRRMP